MKRYLVFIGLRYYPEGGGADFAFATDDLQYAVTKAQENITGSIADMWANVFDAKKCEIVIGFNWDGMEMKEWELKNRA
jgi:hypothetical protein